MRFNLTKRANWVVAMAMLAIPGTLITSCSKDNKTENVENKSNVLTFAVGGIKTNDTGDAVKVGSTKSSATTSKVHSFADVDMVVSTDNNLPTITSDAIGVKRGGGLAADVAPGVTENMVAGTKYVVYIYSGTTLVTSKEFTAGTAGTIEGLNPATTYTWVALSYNTSDANQPALTPTNGSIALAQNKDVLYASGTVNLATNSNISIQFSHKFSRIGIELNTKGVFGNITGNPTVNVTGLNLATGSIALLGGTVTAGASFTPTLTYANFTNIDAAFNDAKIAYVYTASTAAQSAINVQVQNLNISHVDGSLARTYFTTASNFGFSVTPQLGNSHRLLLNVVESPLVTSYAGRTVRWARSNLFYRGNNGNGRNYAFYANNQLTARANGYFAFGSIVPGQFATTTTNNGDPCALVYPAGLWKQPAKADFANMVRGDIEVNQLTGALGGLGQVVDATGVTGLANIITNLLTNTVSLLVNTAAPNSSLAPSSPFNYGQYTLASGANGAPTSGSNAFGDVNSASNRLRFYYNGEISNVNILPLLGNGGLANIGLNDISVDIANFQVANLNIPLLDSYGRATTLWTNEQGANIVGLVGAGTWGYYGNAGRGLTLIPLSLGARFHMANNTGELLNGVSALGANVLSTSFKNVRCVRAN
ncbi:MAG: fimbrillin family protein [Sphingobacterium sp.]|jgi:hypothetical protein|uniref:hypothetical protein n=1 Tax=Sphingobacterium sp. TaxID=341027 RepID=UPI00281FFC47|nr:hypothetical protein [Sphingobacterium sp.]MDR0261987.1 fimbrillin family protein [Sphingobacterium sp.]